MNTAKKKRSREPYQLPAGRHGLPRQFVVSNQRDRILAAVADACSTTGYVAMSVEDIVVSAGVSRRTFYDNYRDKEQAFLAAYDEAAGQLMSRIRDGYAGAEGFVERVRASLRALLHFIASEPTFADMCIVEVLAAGPVAIERRNAVMHALAALIDQAAAEELRKADRPTPIVAETLVGGIYEVIYARVLGDRYAELPGLMPDLIFALLLPYVGSATAKDVYKKERRRVTRSAASAGQD
jgi:AcrR family transcriptional regulator